MRLFAKLLRYFAFDRWRSLSVCLALATVCLALELLGGGAAAGLFAASGAFFTLGGFLLGLKSTAIFHRVNEDGTPWTLEQKYWTVRQSFTFASEVSKKEMEARVRPIERDEIWACGMVVAGTLLWGFGANLLRVVIKATSDCG